MNVSCEYLSSQRKDQLSQLMQLQVPDILSLLMQLLEGIAKKQRQMTTPTPPPSPNVSPIRNSQFTGSPFGHLAGSPIAHLHSGSPSPFGTPPPTLGTPRQVQNIPILGTPPKASPLYSVVNTPFAPLDSATEKVCVLALKCLAHLFSWIPLSSSITPAILDTIFHFASLGCDSVEDVTEHSGNLGSLAMDCINELLVKNCVPREFEAFLMKLFEKSFSLLQRLTDEKERGLSCNFSKLDDK